MRSKRYLVTFLLCGWYIGSSAQSQQVTKYIEQITGLIKKNSIVGRQIDWDKYEKDIAILSRNMNNIDSCKPVLDYIINTLRENGDKHSVFIGKARAEKASSSSPPPAPPQSRLLGAHTGYIKVPGIMSFNDQVNAAFSDTIQQLIKKLDTENDIKGWIVDLRHNTGGGMRPMVAGLNALIPDGIAGYWIYTGSKKRKWYSVGRNLLGTGKFYKIKDLSSPIAVLIDSFTASSGEMTAISFLGRPNVKTFGQPSAGYTTANNTFILANGAMLALAVSYTADRQKKVYKDNIIPDVLIKENTATADDTIEAAVKWVMNGGG